MSEGPTTAELQAALEAKRQELEKLEEMARRAGYPSLLDLMKTGSRSLDDVERATIAKVVPLKGWDENLAARQAKLRESSALLEAQREQHREQDEQTEARFRQALDLNTRTAEAMEEIAKHLGELVVLLKSQGPRDR